MLRSGSLSERIGILVPVVERGDFGEQQVAFEKKKMVWASVTYQKGAQALTSGEVWMTRSISVTMRNNSLINDRCRLEWDGKTYAIESFNRSRLDGSISIVCNVIDEGSSIENG
ncbi:head-tail adaptor protein [Bacteroides thetaiotaomicron]|uniref:head-tail adaptor protein n=1 Tax=Bacteroides thetaiotaomicron TaxID=818 RepID=UPI00204A27C6|nr:head-tail adaptor protein [Bacteroides thetaiotaomicron]MCS2294601.1 head-tail adaptor protein [Bacteroides thetaiotaomicron]DAH70577.1 MAG TPA: head tail joining protein [Caudoviricetes sp.]